MKTFRLFMPAILALFPLVCLAQEGLFESEEDASQNRRQVRPIVRPRQNIQGTANCSATERNQLQAPRIEVSRQGAEPSAARTLRIEGYVEGVCLSDAGLFQSGEKRQSIDVDTQPAFKRFEFALSASPGKNREIRVYNTQGGRASYPLPDSALDTRDVDDPLGIGVKRPSKDTEEMETF